MKKNIEIKEECGCEKCLNFLVKTCKDERTDRHIDRQTDNGKTIRPRLYADTGA